MSGDIHRDMTDLTGALAAAAEIRLKKIAAEEAALRAELAQLDDKPRYGASVAKCFGKAGLRERAVICRSAWPGCSRARRWLYAIIARRMAAGKRPEPCKCMKPPACVGSGSESGASAIRN